MHTVELMEQALGVATRLGYQVRQEWLDETGGGACEFGGRKWLFVNLSLSGIEQLSQVVDALRNDPRLQGTKLPKSLRDFLGHSDAA